MSKNLAHQPQVVVRVSRAEYEQFLRDKTYIPDCLHLDGAGLPDCPGSCVVGLVCVMFVYTDPEQAIEAEWFACAPPKVVAQLIGRVELMEEPQQERKLKFLGYVHEA